MPAQQNDSSVAETALPLSRAANFGGRSDNVCDLRSCCGRTARFRELRERLFNLGVQLVELANQLVVACVESVERFAMRRHGVRAEDKWNRVKLPRISIGTALASGRFLALLAGVADVGGEETFDAKNGGDCHIFGSLTRSRDGSGTESRRGKMTCCAGRTAGSDMAWTSLSLRARLLGSEPTTSR